MTTDLYGKQTIERRLDVEEALTVVEKTYTEMAQGRVLNPSKLTMHLGDDGEWPHMNAFSIDMPAYVGWLDVAGLKWAVATWDTPSEIPIDSRILLFDVGCGEFKAILEGMYITGYRTALQSVVGMTRLLSSAPDTVGMYGAGYQAGFQINAIDSLTGVDTFKIYDIDIERAERLAETKGPEASAEVRVVDDPVAVADSDCLVTVTDSKTPVLEEAWLDPGVDIVALGSYRELPDETVLAADHTVVDHVEQCLERGALSPLVDEGTVGPEDIDTTIGAVLASEYDRSIRAEDRTVLIPIGLGALDVAIASTITVGREDDDEIQSFEFA